MEVIVTGNNELTLKMAAMPETLRANLLTGMEKVTTQLQDRVSRKLLGEVLNRRTGRLYKSIGKEVTVENTLITGRVFTTGVPYAKIHEYGGAVKTRLGRGAHPPRRPGFAVAIMPERSYMRSSLRNLRAEIIQQLSKSVEVATR